MMLGEVLVPEQVAAITVIVGGVVLLFWAPRVNRVDGFGWAIILPLAAAFIQRAAAFVGRSDLLSRTTIGRQKPRHQVNHWTIDTRNLTPRWPGDCGGLLGYSALD